MTANLTRRLWLWLWLVSASLSPPVWSIESEQKVLSLGTFEFNRNLNQMPIGEELVRKSLAEHGYAMQLEYFPGKRLMVQLNSGRLDGDLYRSVNLSRAFDNVVRVDEPLLRSCGLIFRLSSRPDVDVHNRNSALSLGVYDGVPAASNEILRQYPHLKLVFIKKLQQGIDMLSHHRIELLALPLTQEPALHQRLQESTDVVGAIELPSFYLHLHSRHRQLAQDLVPTLQRFKKELTTQTCSLERLHQRLVDTP